MAEEVLVAQADMALWVADRSKIKYIVAEESANSFATIDFFVHISLFRDILAKVLGISSTAMNSMDSGV